MWRDEALVLDMLIAARRARTYLGETSLEDLSTDTLLQDGLVRQLGIVGEAASRISGVYQTAHEDVPWRDVIGMRNRLVHAYWDTDVGEVWRTVTNDLPDLIDTLERLVPPE